MNGIAKFFLFPIGIGFVVVVTVEYTHLYKKIKLLLIRDTGFRVGNFVNDAVLYITLYIYTHLFYLIL